MEDEEIQFRVKIPNFEILSHIKYHSGKVINYLIILKCFDNHFLLSFSGELEGWGRGVMFHEKLLSSYGEKEMKSDEDEDSLNDEKLIKLVFPLECIYASG